MHRISPALVRMTLVLCALLPITLAAQVVWVGPNVEPNCAPVLAPQGGDWSDGMNWMVPEEKGCPRRVPAAGDDVLIAGASAFVVNITQPAACKDLIISSGVRSSVEWGAVLFVMSSLSTQSVKLNNASRLDLLGGRISASQELRIFAYSRLIGHGNVAGNVVVDADGELVVFSNNPLLSNPAATIVLQGDLTLASKSYVCVQTPFPMNLNITGLLHVDGNVISNNGYVGSTNNSYGNILTWTGTFSGPIMQRDLNSVSHMKVSGSICVQECLVACSLIPNSGGNDPLGCCAAALLGSLFDQSCPNSGRDDSCAHVCGVDPVKGSTSGELCTQSGGLGVLLNGESCPDEQSSCNPGFGPPPACPPICSPPDCNGHGYCVDLDGVPACECSVGWADSTCATPVCPESDTGVQCSGTQAGVCDTTTDPPTCTCNAGYSGAACEVAVCSPTCDGITQYCTDVTVPPTCACGPGYEGVPPNCQTAGTTNPGTGGTGTSGGTDAGGSRTTATTIVPVTCPLACNQRGVCDFGVCRCNDPNQWAGLGCEIPVCQGGTQACSQRGTCQTSASPHECECDDGFEGVMCELDLRQCTANCSDRGDCVRSGTGDQGVYCNCNPGYQGMGCEKVNRLARSKSKSQSGLPDYAIAILVLVPVAAIFVLVGIVTLVVLSRYGINLWWHEKERDTIVRSVSVSTVPRSGNSSGLGSSQTVELLSK